MTDGRSDKPQLRPASTGLSGTETFGDLIALGELAVRSGENQAAVDYYFRALDHGMPGSERAGALRRLAYAIRRMGRLEEALDFAVRAAEEAEKADDRLEHARAEIEAGRTHVSLGALDAALREGRHALEVLDSLGRSVDGADALNLLASIHLRRGEHAEARRHYSDALDRFRKAGKVSHLAQAYSNLGTVYKNTGDWSRAMEHYQVACHLGAEDGEYQNVARAYQNLGLSHYHLGNWQEALASFERCRTLATQTSSPELAVMSLLGSALVHREKREWSRATELFREAGETASVHGFTRERALAAIGEGRVLLDLGRVDEAETLLKRALALGKKMAPQGDLVVDAYEALARVHLARGDKERARGFAAGSGELARKNADRLFGALSAEAEALASTADRPRARALLENAAAELESLGDRRNRAKVLRSLGRLLGSGNRQEQAASIGALTEAERLARDLGLRHEAGLALLEAAVVDLARENVDAAQMHLRSAQAALDPEDARSAARAREILSLVESALVQGASRSPGSAATSDLEDLLSSGRSAGQQVDEMLSLLGDATLYDGVAVFEKDGGKLHVLGSHGIPGLTGRAETSIPGFAEGEGTWAVAAPRVILDPLPDSLGPLSRGRTPASVLILPLAPLASTWLYLDRSRESGRPAPKQAEVNFCIALGRQLGSLLAASKLRERASRNRTIREDLMQRVALADIVTQNAEMLEILRLVGKISDSRMTVLLQGETGTGKKLIAQAIHLSSPRAKGPFVTVDCAALAESLLESELFGYVKGAFTGAASDRKGLLEEAHGGTIFLDEIDKTGATVQRRFLHLLDSGETRPVGATAYRPLDVRIICATSSMDLRAEVQAGKFLKDLYYRLNDILVSIPPLRERREDIPLLAEYFVTLYGEQVKKPVAGISRRVIRRLVEFEWPGNVRELEKVIKRAITLAEDGEMIDLHLLPPELLEATESAARAQEVREGGLRESVIAYERAAVVRALERFHWNKSRAAAYLGLSRKGLKNKILRYGLDRRRVRSSP